ncbi:MAG: hypothetical protein O7D32_05360 [bacterium]|nr:hypothetical protein [bacterium]
MGNGQFKHYVFTLVKVDRGIWLYAVFLLSGAAALMYQLIWQRVLFAIYGIDIASVTVVVTAFMLGLGIGSLVGGTLSRVLPYAALPLFAFFEFGIGLFGFFSLEIFNWVGSFTMGIGHMATGLVTFLLVVFPTTMMGATLPLLADYATRRSGNVGRSVGSLYFVNTLGAAIGAFMAAGFLLSYLGLSTSVKAAALLNVGLGLAVVAFSRIEARMS